MSKFFPEQESTESKFFPKEEVAPQVESKFFPKEEKPGFWQRFKKTLDEGALIQMKSGGFAGAPSLSPSQAKHVALQVGTIAAGEAAFAPLIKLAQLSPYAPKILESLTRITQAASTGAAVPAVESLVETGELPSKEELIEEGLTWAAIDAALQATGLGIRFASAVSNISKDMKIPKRQVISRLWKKARSYPNPESITPEDVEVMVKQAEMAEKKGLPKVLEAKEPQVKASVKESVKPVDPMPKEGVSPKIEKPIGTPVKPIEPVVPKEVPTAAPPPKVVPPATGVPKRTPQMGKAQAKKRSDVLNIFRKAFSDPIRLKRMGEFSKTASGFHKVWERVTRLMKDNNVETAAHEIGHNLHTWLYGRNPDGKMPEVPFETQKNVAYALFPYRNELIPISRPSLYEPSQHLIEGFAEFTRMYVTDPASAQKYAPNFYKKFEDDLEADFPEMKTALLKARDYYEHYLQGTSESRVEAQISYAEPEGYIEKLMSFFDPDKLKFHLLDDLFPLKRMVADLFGISTAEVENLKDARNVYRAARVLKGAIGKSDVFLTYETFDFKTLKKTGDGLKEILSPFSDAELKELNIYLVSLRALEKNKQGFDTGISVGDAMNSIEKYKSKYEPTAAKLAKYQNSLLAYYRDAGMLSNKQYRMIKEKNLFYVPFYRMQHPESQKTGGRVSGAGKLQAKQKIKRFKGSEADIIDPLESIVKNTFSLVMEAEKNRVGKILSSLAKTKYGAGKYIEKIPSQKVLKSQFKKSEVVDLVKKGMSPSDLAVMEKFLPDVLQRWTAVKPSGNVITVYNDGKPSYYEVSPEIFDVWEKGLAPYSADLITKILRFPARMLRAGAILNPKFIQKNIVRDTWATALFTKYGSKEWNKQYMNLLDAIYSPLAGLMQAAGKKDLYVNWLKAGGGMSTMQSLDREMVVKKLDEVRKGIRPYQIIKILRMAGEISEEANRLSEFGKALNVEEQSRIGMEIAAFASRDISIDYAKMGLLTKAINQIVPFWNATVQGGDKFIRTLSNPQDREEFLKRGLIFVVLPSLYLAWTNLGNEAVEEQPETTKDFNFLFSYGKDVIALPVPFESGVLMHGLTQRLFKYLMTKDPDAFKGFMGSIMDASVPNLIPAAVNPLIETWANKSFFTGRRIIPPGKENLVPELQYRDYSSATSRVLGRAISYMVGPEKAWKGASPAIIDHFINSWAGGLGNLAVRYMDEVLHIAGLSDKVSRPDEPIIDKLGLNAFIKRFPSSSSNSIEEFYDLYADAVRIHRSIKAFKEIGDEEKYQRISHLDTYEKIQLAYKAMKKNQKLINGIMVDPEIEPVEKRQMVDELYWQQIRFARESNKEIKKFLKESKK